MLNSLVALRGVSLPCDTWAMSIVRYAVSDSVIVVPFVLLPMCKLYSNQGVLSTCFFMLRYGIEYRAKQHIF
jgi:hypothetical protein